MIEIHTTKKKLQLVPSSNNGIMDLLEIFKRKHANGSDGITIKMKEAYLATEKCTSSIS